MFYFSELLNKKVILDNKKKIGKVKDLVFVNEDTPRITKIIIKSDGKKSYPVNIDSIKEINGDVILNKESERQEITDEDFLISKNLLNKQIIDVAGGKVVRVNDVAIQFKEENREYYIAGVDVGFRAILRWFYLEKPSEPILKLLNLHDQPHFLSWGDIGSIEISSGNLQLKKNTSDLEKMRPEDLADYLEKTNIRNVSRIISNLKEEYAADVIEDLNVNYQTALFRRFAPERASKLIDMLEPDEAVDILLTLTKEKRKEILESLSLRKQNKLKSLIKYSKTSVGKLINPDFIIVSSDENVSSATDKFKEQYEESKFTNYMYVLNKEEHLVGVVDAGKLLASNSDSPIYKIMEQDVVVCHLTTPIEIAQKRMLKYKLFALPVIEDNKKMIGVVLWDDMVEEIINKI